MINEFPLVQKHGTTTYRGVGSQSVACVRFSEEIFENVCAAKGEIGIC